MNGKNINVGVDVWGMTPISEERLVASLKSLREGGTFAPESSAAKTRRLLEILEANGCQNPLTHPAWEQIVKMGKDVLVPLSEASSDPSRWVPAALLKMMRKDPEVQRDADRLEKAEGLRKEGKSFREVRRRTGK